LPVGFPQEALGGLFDRALLAISNAIRAQLEADAQKEAHSAEIIGLVHFRVTNKGVGKGWIEVF
jgi:hypothetical protein